LRFSFFRCSSLPSPGGVPALHPALRPAFRVRRGRRCACAAMRRNAPPDSDPAPARLPFCLPQNGSGFMMSPQRTFLLVSVWQRGAQSLHVRRTPKPEVLFESLKVPSYAPRGDPAQSKLAAGSGRFRRHPACFGFAKSFLCGDVSTVLILLVCSFRFFGICKISILEFLDFLLIASPVFRIRGTG
jgi:hypothetical protein